MNKENFGRRSETLRRVLFCLKIFFFLFNGQTLFKLTKNIKLLKIKPKFLIIYDFMTLPQNNIPVSHTYLFIFIFLSINN